MYKTIITFDDEHLEQTLTPNPQSKTENHFTVIAMSMDMFCTTRSLKKKKKKKKFEEKKKRKEKSVFTSTMFRAQITSMHGTKNGKMMAWSLLQSADLRARADSLRFKHTLRSCRMWSKWATVSFHSSFWIPTQMVHLQRCLVVTWLVPRKLLPSRHVLCTPHNHARCHVTSCVATYVRCMHVSCNLPFWHNGRDPLCAVAVRRGWNLAVTCPFGTMTGILYVRLR